MSDFFIGEILVFILLLPVLLRPFFRRLQRYANIPLLAVIAILVCLSLVLTGIRLLFLPLTVFTAIVFLSQISRIVSIARGLPSDYFGTGIKIFYAFLLPLFLVLIAGSVFFIPVPGYIPEKEVYFDTIRKKISTGFKYDFSIFSCSDNLAKNGSDKFLENIYEFAGIKNKKTAETDILDDSEESINLTPVVLFFPGFPAGRSGRDTLAGILAEQGFTCVAVQWNGQNIYPKSYQNNKYLRNLYEVYTAAFRRFSAKNESPLDAGFVGTQKTLMYSVVKDASSFVQKQFGTNRHLYAVAEGYACSALVEAVNENPGLFTGTVYILPETDLENFVEPVTGCAYLAGIKTPLPPAAASMPGLVISDSKETGFGFGEMPAEDPALAAVLQTGRDRDRKTALLTARHIVSWLEMRHPLSMNSGTKNTVEQEAKLEHTGTD